MNDKDAALLTQFIIYVGNSFTNVSKRLKEQEKINSLFSIGCFVSAVSFYIVNNRMNNKIKNLTNRIEELEQTKGE